MFSNVFISFFKSRKCLKSLCLVSMIAVSNVTGVTPILSYSQQTFEKITSLDASLVSIAMGCLTLMTIVVTASTVDRIGRRPLLLFSLACCSLMLLAGAMLERGSIIQVLCISLYPSAMSLGPGTLTYLIIAELFSDRHRGLGASLVTLLAAIATFLGLKFYSVIASIWGLEANFFILCAISTFSAIFIFVFLPETKGKTFEEIQMLL